MVDGLIDGLGFLVYLIVFSMFFFLAFIYLTPNSDNTRDLHPSLCGKVNLEVTCKEATQKNYYSSYVHCF